jgi:NTP pyrophosphatase (non-canonical NTP hydrolase)
MNWKEYLPLSEKTLSTEFHCQKKEELLLHGVIGILTELDELLDSNDDSVNKEEEIADSFWYLAILDREIGLNFEINNEFEIETMESSNDIILMIYKKTSSLLDFLKKKLYYNREIDIEKFSQISNDVFNLFIYFSVKNNINIESALDRNISKLKARYGDKFTSERAINRDLSLERNILEGN